MSRIIFTILLDGNGVVAPGEAVVVVPLESVRTVTVTGVKATLLQCFNEAGPEPRIGATDDTVLRLALWRFPTGNCYPALNGHRDGFHTN